MTLSSAPISKKLSESESESAFPCMYGSGSRASSPSAFSAERNCKPPS
eukprot:CAMPEP_0175761316 /NCGR_PEP_ID=MMETSP0097-20121207/66590_1 /TAXON_ID=311494 /ORGANISM="Alexandrium monilatum, Strain CCMP3105" /LENGTH=47 /DNA_ID= /DNA_START= /DNA_END= /DNA_ORIENTATION=